MTHIGRRRDMNQDYMYTSTTPVGSLPNLFVVADGMGGHNAGEYASRFTVDKMVEVISQNRQQEPVAAMKEALTEANSQLLEEAGASVAGVGILIEKSFQPGRQKLNDQGFEVYSLARVAKLEKDFISFIPEDSDDN